MLHDWTCDIFELQGEITSVTVGNGITEDKRKRANEAKLQKWSLEYVHWKFNFGKEFVFTTEFAFMDIW